MTPKTVFDEATAGELWEFFRGCHEVGEVHWSDAVCAWMVVGYEAMKEFSLDDGTRFRRPWEVEGSGTSATLTSAEWAEFQSLGSERHIFRVNGEDRERQHRWWVGVLSRDALQGWRRELMEPVARAQIDAIAPSGAADLFDDYAAVVPPRTMSAMLGVNADTEWTARVQVATATRARLRQYRGGGTPPAELVDSARAATTELRALLAGPVEARTDGAGLIGLLWRSGADLFGPGFTTLDVIGACSMIWEAGTWSISLATANAAYLIATDPALQAALRADAELIPPFVEECLRLHGPVHARTVRVAVEPTRLGGVDIAPGDRVIGLIGAANRDPKHYERPDEIALARDAVRGHFGFWRGPMICVGQGVSRVQIEVNVTALLDGLADVRLDGDPEYAGTTVRGWRPLPVRFRPSLGA